MADQNETFLKRWSRLKHETPAAPEKAEESPRPTLPPVDKLTPQSDFSSFMHPKVEDALRRVALKKLFTDPHFNLPDPYEAYSGDWTVGEPISEEVLATLNQAQQLLFSDKDKAAAGEVQASADEAAKPEAKTDEPGRQDT